MLYGDTDSLFVESGAADAAAARAFGETLAARLNRDLAAHIQERWRVESRLELVFDRLYLRLCLPAMRHDAGGRPQALRGPGRDATRAARRLHGHGGGAQRLDGAREGGPARAVRAPLRGPAGRGVPARRRWPGCAPGQLDDRLVYRKALRKRPEAYTATTPPHVAVARKLGRRKRARPHRLRDHDRRARSRPEAPQAPLDYEHYLDKQVRAVAEPVLALLGLDLDEILGTAKQLRLF